MFWKKREDTKSSDNNALVRQDPRTKVRTATAQSQTTNTTNESVTIIDQERNTVINRNIRQTVTHEQKAVVAEFVTRRTPTKEELEAITANGFFQQTTVTRTNGAHQKWFADQENVKINRPQPSAWRTQTPPTASSGSTTKPTATTYAATKSNTTTIPPFSRDTTATRSTSRSVAPLWRGSSTDPKSTVGKSQSTTSYTSPYLLRGSSTDPKSLSTAAKSQSTSNYTSPYLLKGSSMDAKPFSTTATSQSTNSYTSPYLSRGSSMDAKPFSTTTTSQSTNSYASPYLRVPPPERMPTPATTAAITKPTKSMKTGHAFLINSVNFKGKDKRRNGSDIDAERMCKVLKSFKLNVNMYRDPKVQEVNDIVKKIKKIDHTNYGCLVIVILSHGGKSEMIEAIDGHYNVDATLLHPILTIPSLKNKPKLFFIQACKGDMVPGEVMKDAATVVGPPSEILKCYSTFEGYVAFRTDSGSFFMDSLCRELESNGRHTDIEQIMKKVTAEVKERSKYV